MKKWEILNKQTTKNKQQRTNEVILQILLKNRGVANKKDIEEFLNPKLENITLENTGLDKKELEKAAVRIKNAKDEKESVIVYTDYDADGITSGAIVWETLFHFGIDVMPYVPDRIKEGYGLSKIGINFIKKEFNPTLMIAVDHGVTAIENIEYALSLGIETIILDHHLLPRILPRALALVHTTKLCSGGIAWIFCNYLYERYNAEPDKSHELTISNIRNLDLAAIATIADLVPLTGLNRTIAKYGLEEINKTKRIGLNAMIKDAGLTKGKIDVYEVGHMLSPRINAMGRMAHALDALRLLCTKDKNRATILAGQLSLVNRNRQEKTVEATLLAFDLAKEEIKKKLIFISHNDFAEGIIGLVAGKLTEEFYLPSIVISEGEILSKASARSINSFNIVQLLKRGEELLEDIGGHPMAAGFTIASCNIKKLKKKLTDIAEIEIKEEHLIKKLIIDTVIPVSAIDMKLYKEIQRLKPFGMGNPEPVFASFQVVVIGCSQVGRDKKHLKLKLKDEKNNSIDAIGFNLGDLFRKINPGMKIDIAYKIMLDKWNGNNRLQLHMKDVKFTD